MSDVLHERIAAAVAGTRRRVEFGRHMAIDRALLLRACDHADKVLARHADDDKNWRRQLHPEVRDLADLWLGPGWDQS